MTHFRAFFDSEFLGVWDLGGRDRVVTIVAVKPGSVGGQQGRKKEKKAVIKLREFDKEFVANVTNCKSIAGIYGASVEGWKGKRITLYETTTQFGGETVPCIRIRPGVPRGEPSEHVKTGPVDQEVRAKQDRAARRSEHPAAPIAAATDAASLREALAACAPWIAGNHEKAWPRVEARCAELGLDVAEATEIIARAASGAPDA